MKAYGLNRIEAGDLDVAGASSNGRATHFYSTTERSYKSLRGGRKASARRTHKRRARAASKALTADRD